MNYLFYTYKLYKKKIHTIISTQITKNAHLIIAQKQIYTPSHTNKNMHSHAHPHKQYHTLTFIILIFKLLKHTTHSNIFDVHIINL